MGIDLNNYDRYILAFSGGRGSVAALVTLLSLVQDRSKIELWHYMVDGEDGCLIDWPVTANYCFCIAHEFGIPIYFGGRYGGFKNELLRENQRQAMIAFDTPRGTKLVSSNKRRSTRRKLPRKEDCFRWCSECLKADVVNCMLSNQERLNNSKTLFISSEHEPVKPLCQFTKHRMDARGSRFRRHIDHWRPLLRWKTDDLWGVMQRMGIVPHPAYYLGWNRLRCMICFYGNDAQWRAANVVAPRQVAQIMAYEKEFGMTVNAGRSIESIVGDGLSRGYFNELAIDLAMGDYFDIPIRVPFEKWTRPNARFHQ